MIKILKKLGFIALAGLSLGAFVVIPLASAQGDL